MNRRRLAESVCYNETTSTPPIQFKSLLNKVHRLKSFVYHSVRMSGQGDKARIIAEVVPRANSRPRCSGCGKPRPGYDRMSRPREFEFIPVWNIPVSLSYTMRRVDCPTCGIKVEAVPWAQGKHACCDVYRHFLASWARRLSWKETAACFHTNWDTVCRSVKWVVDFGLKHRDLENITAIGVDEVTYSKGHKYMTLVYQIDSGRKRLLGVIRDRDTRSLSSFFETFGAERCAKIKVVCSDMWKPYLNVIAAMLPAALNVLDRFHIAKKLGEAVDEVRRQEAKQLAADGYEPVLKNSRYCFLKRRSNLTIPAGHQTARPAQVRPQIHPCPRAQGILRRLLAIRQSALGGLVSQEMVHPSHAEQARTHEEVRRHAAQPRGSADELLQGRETL